MTTTQNTEATMNGNNGRRPHDAKVWNCSFCHATNVHGPICGCAASREANGEEPAKSAREQMAELNAITIELPARKVRPLRLRANF
jgi:hypothetical protein